MRHRLRKYSSFGLKPKPRKALLKNLIVSLVENERIKTTLPKARTVRRLIERVISIGKKKETAKRRLLLSRYPNKGTIDKVMEVISPRFIDRPGGYTRIIKLGERPGDRAEMAYLEFVDYDPSKGKEEEEEKYLKNSKTKKSKEEKPKKSKKSKESILKKQSYLKKKKKKKHIRKIQAKSRNINRKK